MMARRKQRIYPDLVTYFRESGDTQVEFAKRLKRTQSYVSKLVNRRVEPNLADALVISREANVPLESLVTATDEVSTP